MAGMSANAGLSLVTSLHCAAMCGPLVIAVLAKDRRVRPSHVLLYNLGRGVSYAAAGLTIGSISGTFASLVPNLGPLIALLAGVVILVYALKLWFPEALVMPQFALFRTGTSYVARKAQRWPYNLQAFLLGLLTVLLPCMTLSPALVASIGTQSAMKGMAYMLSFFVGTLPVMILTPLLPNAIKVRLSKRAERLLITGFLVVSAAITFLRAFPDIHHHLHKF